MDEKSLTTKKNKLWIYIGIVYGIITAILIDLSLYKKICEGIFIYKIGCTKFIIDISIIILSIIISIAGYIGQYIFSLVCFIGFSLGTILFLIYTLLNFWGFEFIISISLLLYINMFTIILSIIFQFCYKYINKNK